MIERFINKDFYKYIDKTVVEFKNKFTCGHGELNNFLIKTKNEILKNCSSEVRENTVLTAFNRNPFKSCQYDNIGKFSNP
jgi:hypothetical protein